MIAATGLSSSSEKGEDRKGEGFIYTMDSIGTGDQIKREETKGGRGKRRNRKIN